VKSETVLAILDSNAVGIILGALIALGATALTDHRRARRESKTAARDARKAVHVDAIRAMYSYREAAREFRKARLAESRDPADVEARHVAFVQAGVAFGEHRFLTMALGYQVVAETVHELGVAIAAWAFEGYEPFEAELAESDPHIANADREDAVNTLIGLVLGMVGEDSEQPRLTP
jgi:hypothetical protein